MVRRYRSSWERGADGRPLHDLESLARRLAAYSRAEAARRGLPSVWLSLAESAALLEAEEADVLRAVGLAL
eukprot:262616-Alexandrium_andersonii.AAC.1